MKVKLTTSEKADIIKVLENQRIYFETRNRELAIKYSKLISKVAAL